MSKSSLSRREFLGWSAAGLAALAARRAFAADAPGFVPTGSLVSNTYAGSSAALKVADPSRITLLQFTDLHFFCKSDVPEADKKTVEYLPRLVEQAKPDLLLVTGDFWHDNPEGRGRAQAEFAVAQISALGVPWVFTWGNHDMLDDIVKGHDLFHDAKHSLYRGGPAGGNYSIQLQDQAGATLWDLVCLNTSSHGMDEAPRAWLRGQIAARNAAAAVPGFGVFHIPLKQLDEGWASPNARGVKLGGKGSGVDTGETLGLLAQLGVRAACCGHIHTNDYSVVSDGVELIYGHATGAAGWGGETVPKGAKIHTINAQSGSHAWETLLVDGTRWSPAPGVRVEEVLDTPWDSPAKQKRKAA